MRPSTKGVRKEPRKLGRTLRAGVSSTSLLGRDRLPSRGRCGRRWARVVIARLRVHHCSRASAHHEVSPSWLTRRQQRLPKHIRQQQRCNEQLNHFFLRKAGGGGWGGEKNSGAMGAISRSLLKRRNMPRARRRGLERHRIQNTGIADCRS